MFVHYFEMLNGELEGKWLAALHLPVKDIYFGGVLINILFIQLSKTELNRKKYIIR